MKSSHHTFIISLLLFGFLKPTQLHSQEFQNVNQTENIFKTFGTEFFGGGISFEDFNHDGWDDLTFASSIDKTIYVYQNIQGHFQLESYFDNLLEADVRQILWVDYDNDGDKDLFVTTNEKGNRLFNNDGDFSFSDITESAGLPLEPNNVFGACFTDINNDGWLDLYWLNYNFFGIQPNDLFLNNNGIFTKITDSAGLNYAQATSLAVAALDFDKDGLSDLYISEDRTFGNRLFKNNGDLTFEDISELTNSNIAMDAMNVGIGDPNRDGFPDIYITNYRTGINPLSKLLLNSNGEYFDEVAESSGVLFENRIGFGGSFFDSNNNGWEDLYVCNAETDGGDTLFNALYLNDAQGAFNEINFIGDNHQSFSNSVGDFNNDGRPDIAVSHGENEVISIWKNTTNNNSNFVKVKLTGMTTNIDAIGSEIQVWTEGIKQTRWVLAGESYLAQNSSTKHFGIAESETIDSLIVLYPGGIVEKFYDLSSNVTYQIIEGESIESSNYSLPIASYNVLSSTEACQSQIINFINLSDNYTSWEWHFENGTPATSTELNPSVSFEAIGEHDVTLIVTNDLGSDTLVSNDLISIKAPPQANFSHLASNNVVGFTNESQGSDLQIFWDFGDGIGESEEESPFYVYDTPGSYEVTLISTNTCGTDTLSQTVNAFSAPNSAFSATTQDTCVSKSILFMDESSGIIDSWQWIFEGGVPNSSNDINPLVTYNEAGNYSVTLTTSNAQGENTFTSNQYISINTNPIPDLQIDQSDLNIQIINDGIDFENITWDFGDNQTSNDSSPSHSYPYEGHYQITATFENECGQSIWNYPITIIETPAIIDNFESIDFPSINTSYGHSEIPTGGLSFKDFDQDGLDDLTFCTNGDQTLHFYRNTGNGFEQLNLIEEQAITTHATWIDYDNDGDQDLFVTSWDDINRLYINTGDLSLSDVTDEALLPNDIVHSSSCTWGDFDEDGWIDLYIANYDSLNSNFIFRNNADGTFFDFSTACGATDTIKPTYSAGFFDMNNNGKQDIYTLEDNLVFGNSFFKNLGFNAYEDIASINGTNLHLNAHGLNIVDINQDGLLDIHFTNKDDLNTILINEGNETFTVAALGIGNGLKNDWGSVFFDLDNDGDEDLYTITADTSFHNAFFIKNGNEFENGFSLAEDNRPGFSVAKGDINNDGNIDLGILNQTESSSFWLNQNVDNHNYLKVHLTGTVSNRDGIGSWVEIYVNGNKQIRYTTATDGFRAQNSQYLHFGLADATLVDSLKIHWISGITDIWRDVPANQVIYVEENASPINPNKLTKQSNTSILLYPTEVHKSVSINVFANKNMSSEIHIVNSIGQSLIEYSVNIIPGNNTFSFDLSELPNGAYFLTFDGKSRYFSKY